MTTKKTRGSGKHPNILDLCAADVMQEDLVMVRANDTLEEAERLLTEAQIGGAPVVDAAGTVIGVISVRDLVRHRMEDGEIPADVDAHVFDNDIDESEQVTFERPTSGACAADAMTADIVSVAPTAALANVAARMVETNVHRVLVLDRSKLIGLVSTMDVLKALAERA